MPKLYIGNSPLAVGIVTNTEATATAEDIAEGKTAWANGAKLTGTGEMARDLAEDLNTQDELIAQIFEELEGKAAGEGGLVVSDDGQGNVTIVTNGADIEVPSIIGFTIDGISYQAYEGMTWGEWIVSEYNTDGFLCDAEYVYSADGVKVNNVLPTDEIITNATYNLTRFYLYNEGNEYEDVTGGWSADGYSYTSSATYSVAEGTKNSDHLYVDSYGGSTNIRLLGTTNAIDLTKYSKLYVDATETGAGGTALRIGASKTMVNDGSITEFDMEIEGRNTYEFSIEEITGEMYIMFGAQNTIGRSLAVYKMWLE